MSRLPFELLLALRYLRPKRTFVSVITLISVLGVTLGVAVLIIVISVMSGFDRELKEKIFGNMSSRAAEMLKDDLEAAPPAKLSDVEASQKEILTVARRLSDAGEINLGGGGGDEYV